VPHSAAGRSRTAGNKCDDRLTDVRLDVLGCFLLRRTTDLADHHDGVRVRVVVEHLDNLALGGANNGVTTNAHTGRLADTATGYLIDAFVNQSAAARNDADVAALEDVAHDTDATFVRRDDAGAVRTDESDAAAAKRA
jgi:hypothetical protein